MTGNITGTTNQIEATAIIAVFTDKTVKVFNCTQNTIDTDQCYFVILYEIF